MQPLEQAARRRLLLWVQTQMTAADLASVMTFGKFRMVLSSLTTGIC
jgi:hypothetical protein